MAIQTRVLGKQFFSKMNYVSLSLQGKQLTIFVARDNFWVFQQKLEKLEFWKTYWQLPNS